MVSKNQLIRRRQACWRAAECAANDGNERLACLIVRTAVRLKAMAR